MTNETPSQREIDRNNDKRFLTPLLLMALVIAGGLLIHLTSGRRRSADERRNDSATDRVRA
jgi:hypothetical protein